MIVVVLLAACPDQWHISDLVTAVLSHAGLKPALCRTFTFDRGPHKTLGFNVVVIPSKFGFLKQSIDESFRTYPNSGVFNNFV